MKTQTAQYRKERPEQAPTALFDLQRELGKMKSESVWKNGGHDAITLINGPRMRIVLVAMHENAEILSHRTDHPISVQVLEGAVEFRAGSESVSLGAGQLLRLKSGISHGIRAVQESAFLLTLATK